MPKHSQPRRGSLQYWPRKRARKLLPSVNWNAVSDPKKKQKKGLLGFIAYKVGMKSCLVRDNTEHSLTKGSKINIPVTILEAPHLKIFSVRFYKQNIPIKEIFIGGEKDLKRRVKTPKKKHEGKINLDEIKSEDYEGIKVIVYSLVNTTSIKKKPDFIEVGIGGSKEEQLETVKNLLNKEISVGEVFREQDKLVDVRGVTKGKGTQGPVKRFGVSFRFHKSEKGVRKVGSIGPWHPARVMFTVPMAGQTGFFSRIGYNNQIIASGKITEKDINPKEGFKHFGKIKTDYVIVRGSVVGPAKRQLVLTETLRPTKKQLKKNFEFLELR